MVLSTLLRHYQPFYGINTLEKYYVMTILSIRYSEDYDEDRASIYHLNTDE